MLCAIPNVQRRPRFPWRLLAAARRAQPRAPARPPSLARLLWPTSLSGGANASARLVAREMQRAGRVVWRGLALRAPLADPEDTGGRTRWAVAMPDVYSIRHTTVEDYTEAAVHEIKVSRADLLADLRRQDKGAAYLALASQCWYVLRRGIADPDEVPAGYGVMLADDAALEVARPAPRRAWKPTFPVWMALARAAAEAVPDDSGQGLLGEPPSNAPP